MRDAVRTLSFVSTMGFVPWGGSEYLWHGTARNLLGRGVSVHTRTALWPQAPAPVAELVRAGASASFGRRTLGFGQRLLRRVQPRAVDAAWRMELRKWLETVRPDGCLVSCGSLRDDFSQLAELAHTRIPYAVVIHGAAPETWPHDSALKDISDFLVGATKVFFVSEYGREDVQQCVGQRLEGAEVIWNPLNLEPGPEAHAGFPTLTAGLRIACAARLSVETKGQDLLLRTFALPKWRSRDVSLTLYGEGPQRQVLQNAAKYLRLANVSFAGHAADVRAIWRDHHLGVLASRYEGMPLSLTEAMAMSRTSVVTKVGGVDELVTDDDTAFIAAAPTVAALDDALERAWQRRSELEEMGKRAALRLRAVMPADPCAELADRLLAIFPSQPR
jgi:glycosyltransferase involved in cell wall biosynthesis